MSTLRSKDRASLCSSDSRICCLTACSERADLLTPLGLHIFLAHFTPSLACFFQCSIPSIHNRKVSLVVCERAWESPYGNPGRMALCARGLSSIVEKLPRQRAAFRPAGSLRPDQQH